MILTLSRPLSRTATLFALALSLMTVASCGYNTIPTLEEEAKKRRTSFKSSMPRRVAA